MPKPIRLRWHRLIHTVLGTQMAASSNLASLIDLKWRLAQAGIPTRLVSEWLIC